MYKTFKDMPIWQKAMEIAESVHKLTDGLPKKEDYGFTSQIRRASLSISANIAEAFGRKHVLDKINFYYFSRGSLTETQSHLEYGRRVGYIGQEHDEKMDRTLADLYNEVNKLIHVLKQGKAV
jgi:four helix bundle protein